MDNDDTKNSNNDKIIKAEIVDVDENQIQREHKRIQQEQRQRDAYESIGKKLLLELWKGSVEYVSKASDVIRYTIIALTTVLLLILRAVQVPVESQVGFWLFTGLTLLILFLALIYVVYRLDTVIGLAEFGDEKQENYYKNLFPKYKEIVKNRLSRIKTAQYILAFAAFLFFFNVLWIIFNKTEEYLPPLQSSEASIHYINGTKVHLRKKDKENSTSICILYEGTKLEVIETKGHWKNVFVSSDINCSTGWVHSNYIGLVKKLK